MKVRFGIGMGGESEPAVLAASAEAILEHGFDSIWLPEILTRPGPDPVAALGWLNGRHPRLKIGTTMLLPGRHLLRLAKQLATLDQLSNGRFLVTFVPGIAQGAERDAIGVPVRERGEAIEQGLPTVRRLLEGEEVGGAILSPLPAQKEFSMWLGGNAPASLDRCGRLADGWLPSLLTPADAASGRAVIERAAEGAGREIDPEHFGVSIGYSRGPMPEATRASLAARSKGRDLAAIFPQSLADLRALVEGHLEAGFSKFVLRPSGPVDDWSEELGLLAGAVNDLVN
ncbi:MAG TPA: LLM class flavin-dependent oxidoreductase [Acidimicrobiales bacterium]